jgi:phosphoribosylamine--glycine ligase
VRVEASAVGYDTKMRASEMGGGDRTVVPVSESSGFTKKKFLFISLIGLAMDFAWQVKKEGHDVKFYLKYSDDGIGSGFFQMVDNWEKHVKWADVIVFDDVEGQGTHAKKLRAKGKLVFGGTPYTDKLEDDRSFGQDEMKQRGIPILSYQTFTDFDEGIEYVKNNPDAYVIKPSGPAQNYKDLLFVGQEEDGSDIVRMLETYKRVWAKKIKVFQLQKRVTGVEVGVGVYTCLYASSCSCFFAKISRKIYIIHDYIFVFILIKIIYF